MMSGRAKKKEYELLALELWTKSYVGNRESYINENTLAHAMKTVERSAINVDSASEHSSSGSVCCFIRPLFSGDSSRKHWIIFLITCGNQRVHWRPRWQKTEQGRSFCTSICIILSTLTNNQVYQNKKISYSPSHNI